MNTGDFEDQLRRQPIRPVPRDWRGEILDAAGRARDAQPSTLNPQPASRWRQWLWPCPQAWAGLAAAWLVVLLLNWAARDPVRLATTSKAAPAPELFLALKEHRRLVAELIGTPRTLEPAKPLEPRPRSEVPRPALPIEFA